MANRTVGQAYTHTVTLKQNLADEKKGTAFVLFDDGKVFDQELMAFRVPVESVCFVVKNFADFPMLVSVEKNAKYHQHEFKEKSILVCECGAVDE